MFQYKNHEQNILINNLTPDKKSWNTIHYNAMSVMLRYFCKNTHVSFTVNKLRYSSQVIFFLWFSHHVVVYH